MTETAQDVVACPSCGARYRIGEHLLGRKVACRRCGTLFRLGEPANGIAPRRAEPGPELEAGAEGADEIGADDSYLLMGRLALKYGFLDLAQLRDVLAFQEQERRRGRSLRLGEILITQGLLSHAQLDFLLSVQNMLELRKRDQRFGLIAVKNGFASEAQIEAALAEQKRRFKATRTLTPLGDLLVAAGVLTEAKKNAVLAKQRRIKAAAARAPAAPDEPPPGSAPLAAKPHPGEPPLTQAPAVEAPAAAAIESQLELTVSADQLQAFLVHRGGAAVELAAVRRFLDDRGIAVGRAADDDVQSWLEDPLRRARPLQVAAGRPVEPGEDARLHWSFTAPATGLGDRLENDSDAQGWTEPAAVEVGDLLVEKSPARPGRSGIDVYGRELAPAPVRDLDLPTGAGTRVSDDGLKLFAAVAGVPEWLGPDRLTVVPVLAIAGDVDASVGDIQFDGAVQVAGTVQSGRSIRAVSVSARELYRAVIEVSGAVRVRGGVIGCRVRAGGEIRAKHVRESKLEGGANLVVERELIDARVELSGGLWIPQGAILASKISAKKGIEAAEIGSDVARPSLLQVGVDTRVQRQIAVLRESIGKHRAAAAELEARLAELAEAADRIQQEIGELAQVQDRALVSLRRIEGAQRDAEAAGGPAAAAAASQDLAALQQDIAQREQRLEDLFDLQDRTAQDEAETRQALREATATSELLEGRILEWTERANAEPGKAEVRVRGRIYPDTEIEGRYATFKVHEVRERVEIVERRTAGAAGALEWRFLVRPLADLS